MFDELICIFAGHRLEKSSERVKGPLPGFKCSRCGREIKNY